MLFGPIDRAIADLTSLQAGLVARWQVLERGGTDDHIKSRLRSGRWIAYRPGVYLVNGQGRSPHRELWAVVLAAGPQAAISHESAGRLHGADLAPQLPVITVPHPSHPRLIGAVVHQSTDLKPRHVAEIHGLPVTTPARTFVDLAAVLDRKSLRGVGEQFLVDRRVTAERLSRMFASLNRPGKRGFRQLAEVLDGLIGAGGIPESKLERKALGIITAAGIETPVPQHPFPGRLPGAFRVDLAFVAQRVIIEVDGRPFHTRDADAQRDRERDLAAAAAGWIVIRVMWETLRDNPDWFVDRLREVLSQRAGA
jgi:hypothetical protein